MGMGTAQIPFTFPVVDHGDHLRDSSDDFRFAAAVAEYGMVLRGSKFKGTASFQQARHLAKRALSNDKGGHRKEFLKLIRTAEDLGGNGKGLAIAR